MLKARSDGPYALVEQGGLEQQPELHRGIRITYIMIAGNHFIIDRVRYSVY